MAVKTMLVLTTTLLLLASHLNLASTKKVVLFSAPHAANVRTHTNIGRALTAKGHEAFVCIPEVMIKEKQVSLGGFKAISYKQPSSTFEEMVVDDVIGKFWTRELDMAVMMQVFLNKTDVIVHDILADAKLLKTLRQLKPDLFVMTHFPPFRGLLVIPYALDVPFMTMGPLYEPYLTRIPFNPPSTPNVINEEFQSKDMSFLQRLKNTLANAVLYTAFSMLPISSYLEAVAPEKPKISFAELMQKSEMYLIESDHILEYPRPMLPNTVLIGGTASTPAKPPQEPFKSFIDGAPDGVILITFGSAIIDIPDERVLSTMIAAFKKMKQRIVWRANIESTDSPNILTSKWVPQNDILAHKNTKLFVSHCGANGQYEALFHGVPILCLPFNGDQYANAHRTVDKGFGLRGDIRDLTEQEWIQLTTELIKNPIYRENIQKASRLYRELYKLPIDTAAYWIDHVLEYGGSYMRSAGQDMELYQYLMLDVLAFLTVLVILFVCVLCKLCRCACRLCCGRGKKTKVE